MLEIYWVLIPVAGLILASNCKDSRALFSKVCGWETDSLQYLQIHEKHHNNNLYKCEYCGKFFRDEAILERHRRDHTLQRVSKLSPFLITQIIRPRAKRQ